SSLSDFVALVSIEGSKNYFMKQFYSDKKTKNITLQLTPEMQPNAFVNVLIVKNNKLYDLTK
ncbi:MAG: hypothetical protein Q7K42_01985, partial [Candidatus Diapherotrites archaeon]|nr:hypothetical protein [Candidatus Diapherotrites archaeon]